MKDEQITCSQRIVFDTVSGMISPFVRSFEERIDKNFQK